MNANPKIQIDNDAWLEASNIAHDVFAPLKGFMSFKDYTAVVQDMHLAIGEPWTIPITLEVPEEQVKEVQKSNSVDLVNEAGNIVAGIEVEDVFQVDLDNDITKIFGTSDKAHPGVEKEITRSAYRVGGTVTLHQDMPNEYEDCNLFPSDTREIFKRKGWQTITGFQTRNPLHRAHEYLQRVAMEITDGIFIHPLIGWKKPDDFSPFAVMQAYRKMFDSFYPSSRALLGTLMTPMRYAGPREAVFHAIIRRNFGCTHFIVGRDHAGVGNYYGKYEAHELCRQFTDLGIVILTLCGPYYCKKCGGIVTEKSCSHGDAYILDISGTEMRRMLSKGTRPPEEYMRPEISDVLIELSSKGLLFCGDKVTV